MTPVRLAIVDDAHFVREALTRLLKAEPRVEVVGTAATGEELLARLDEWRPDVITLDLNMPGIGGLETLSRLMATRPVPVIILSTHSGEGAPVTLEALARGAVDFLDKEAYSLMDFESLRAVLVQKILHVAPEEAGAAPPRPSRPSRPSAAFGALDEVPTTRGDLELVVVGASTGGPKAVETVLHDIGTSIDVPILVVQHMPEGFTRAFAERLDRHLPLRVREAEDGMVLRGGGAVIAPAGRHLRVRRDQGQVVLSLHEEPAAVAHRPSVDVLFRSAAEQFGARAVGILLTGMGSDGALGMGRLAQAGAHTIAQDEASCVVWGMPRAAAELGAAREVVALDQIGSRVRELATAAAPQT